MGGGPIASWLSVSSSSSLYIVAVRPRLRGATKNPVSTMFQWTQDPLGQHILKRLALDAFQHDAQHIGGVAVGHPVTGLMVKR